MNYDLLIKILGMTQSSHDGEVLAAIGKANALLKAHGKTWKDIVSPPRVSVHGAPDPFGWGRQASQQAQPATSTNGRPEETYTEQAREQQTRGADYWGDGYRASQSKPFTDPGEDRHGPTGDESAAAYAQRRPAEREEYQRAMAEMLRAEMLRAQQERDRGHHYGSRPRQRRGFTAPPPKEPPIDTDDWSIFEDDTYEKPKPGTAGHTIDHTEKMVRELVKTFTFTAVERFSMFAFTHLKEATWLFDNWKTNVMANAMMRDLMDGKPIEEEQIKVIQLAMLADKVQSSGYR